MSSTSPRLQIHFLGSFRVTLDGEVITQFDADSARALFAYLVLNPDHAHQRTALANLFWCDQSPESSLHNLRSALNRVRKALNDSDDALQPLILARRQTIQWNPQVETWVDVLEFERLLATVKHHVHRRLAACPWCMKQLTKVAELYRGEFLADLKVTSLPFEEWQQIEREHLHRLAMQSFHILADYHQQGEAYSEAERYARRQIGLERWNEEAHQQLIYALYATGQRSAALAQYEACRGILAAEFGVAPTAAMTALYEEIRRHNRPNQRQSMLAFDQHDCVRTSWHKKFPNNLPHPTTPCVNRQAELDTLLQRVVNPANRLTTLIGEGGIGKTHLALTTARALVRSFADGVWFVPLAELPALNDSQQAEAAIVRLLCQTLKIDTAAAASPTPYLLGYLQSKELLLVLDNFEHLLAGAPFLHRVLHAALNVTVLATSRQPLGFQAEHLLRVPALQQAHAVQLFVKRVRASYPEFVATAEQMSLVEEICSYLHGRPLAIELAAAEVRRLGLTAVYTIVKHGPGQLATTHPDVPERHRSLRAVFHHSWQLLSPGEQHALGCIARFSGAFDALVLQALTGLPSGLLADLRDKSVLLQDTEGRYQVPALMRPFAIAFSPCSPQ